MDSNIAKAGSRVPYGWFVVAVFLKPLTKEFGWSQAATPGAMSVVMAVSGLIGIVMVGRRTAATLGSWSGWLWPSAQLFGSYQRER